MYACKMRKEKQITESARQRRNIRYHNTFIDVHFNWIIISIKKNTVDEIPKKKKKQNAAINIHILSTVYRDSITFEQHI